MTQAAAAVALPEELESPSEALLADYPVADSGYDEMYSAPGVLRPHWQAMAQSLETIGGEELERRHGEVQRLLQTDGVTCDTYDDPQGPQRHWLVDPIPLLMTGEEWTTLAEGLEQRSRLMNALLVDLYDRRLAIRQGWLPPELVYAHPGFLHPCHHSYPMATVG